MKKTATMTWIHNNNYGSILQAYALQTYLKNRGYHNTLIDYNPTTINRVINLFRSGNSIKLFYEKFKIFSSKKHSKKTGYDITKKHIKFKDFIDKYLNTTKCFSNPKELKTLQGEYDVYICGSDQIWNPELLNPPYYFDFLSKNDKRISYAPSFAVKEISLKKQKKIKKLLDCFSHISVREQQGKDLLKDMGYDTKDIPVVLDPTLLLSKEEWEKFAKNSYQQPKDKYLLCYFLGENPIYWNTAKKIAEKLNVKIFVIPDCEDAYKQKQVTLLDDVGPTEWVQYIKNAEFVLTDSFHGILFSLIFHKDFYAYKRFKDLSGKSQNSRVENIMEKVGLKDRLYDNDKEIEDIEFIDNYEVLDKKIEKYKENSIKYLINSIEN